MPPDNQGLIRSGIKENVTNVAYLGTIQWGGIFLECLSVYSTSLYRGKVNKQDHRTYGFKIIFNNFILSFQSQVVMLSDFWHFRIENHEASNI